MLEEERITEQEIKRLNEFCEREGLKLIVQSNWLQIFQIIKKYPWEGVEFVRIKGTREIIRFNECQYLDKNKEGYYTFFERFVPATETEYVEQLKKEAFERFGEIKEDDRFEIKNTINNNGNFDDFYYLKDVDAFYAKGAKIYQSGKWATKFLN